ncbi:hypothetical protein AgCh_031973 [Apium graveolens]
MDVWGSKARGENVVTAAVTGPGIIFIQSMPFHRLSQRIASSAIKKFELVECDLEKSDQIGPAIENASTMICCIGASEKEISDITGPY